ncbi:hypothetical protein [Rhodococcoides kyotonense]|nr:hypothetical protein [Rhodococcus kyotonensis]
MAERTESPHLLGSILRLYVGFYAAAWFGGAPYAALFGNPGVDWTVREVGVAVLACAVAVAGVWAVLSAVRTLSISPRFPAIAPAAMASMGRWFASIAATVAAFALAGVLLGTALAPFLVPAVGGWAGANSRVLYRAATSRSPVT